MWLVCSSVGLSFSIYKVLCISGMLVVATVFFFGALRVFAPGFVRMGSVVSLALIALSSSFGPHIN